MPVTGSPNQEAPRAGSPQEALVVAMGQCRGEALPLSRFLAPCKALECLGSHQCPSMAWPSSSGQKHHPGCQLPWVWLPCLQARAGDSSNYHEAVQGLGQRL